MNKILVLAKNQNTYFIRRLKEEVDLNSLEMFNPFEQEKPKKLLDPDVILSRSTGVYFSDRDLDFLKVQSAKIINPLQSLITFRSKSIQYDFLDQNNFSILPWKKCETNLGHLKEFKSLLVKPDKGQGGRGIRIFTKDDFQFWYDQQILANDLDYVLQPYVETNREVRVFFIGDKLWVLERWSDSGPVNFFQGGYARPALLEKNIENEVRRLIHCSEAFYGAIDILIDNSNYYFLELNTVPGIEQLEKIFKDNFIKLLIRGMFSS